MTEKPVKPQKRLSIVERLRISFIKRDLCGVNYPYNRLNRIHYEISHWVASSRNSKTTAEKNFCSTMIVMYQKRYQWYLNKCLVK